MLNVISQRSLTKDCPLDTEPVGRSGGSRALVSCDKKLFIKTIQNEQVAEMHRILKEYHQVVNNRDFQKHFKLSKEFDHVI